MGLAATPLIESKPVFDLLAEGIKIGEVHNLSFEDAVTHIHERIAKHQPGVVVKEQRSGDVAFCLPTTGAWSAPCWEVIKEFDACGDIRADPPFVYTLVKAVPSATVGYVNTSVYEN